MDDTLKAISVAVRDGDQVRTSDLVTQALRAGTPAAVILSDALVPGMQALGALFHDGHAFLPEILISARAMHAGLGQLRPHLMQAGVKMKGTVVLGTVAGDLHDIGKTLVGLLLEGNGFTVVDLGVDVAADAFVEAARRHDAGIVALSALLTASTPQFHTVVEAVRRAGLAGEVKVMVGGAAVSAALAQEAGADGFAPDCVAAAEEAARLLGRPGAE